jgi:hypothetical protein
MASLPLSGYVLNKGIPTTVLLDATANKRACDSRANHTETFLAWVRHVIQEGHIRTQNIPRDDNVVDFMVKPYNKATHRATVRQLMGPFQALKIRRTGGETLKRTLDAVYELTTTVIVEVLCSQFK